jgi:hypothetical protein
VATYYSKSQVKEALQDARRALKNARSTYGKESQEAKDALKECNNLQAVLDRWDALNS